MQSLSDQLRGIPKEEPCLHELQQIEIVIDASRAVKALQIMESCA